MSASEKTKYVQDSIPSLVSDIHWECWDVSPVSRGDCTSNWEKSAINTFTSFPKHLARLSQEEECGIKSIVSDAVFLHDLLNHLCTLCVYFVFGC